MTVKAVSKSLVKLTLGLDFINFLRTAFTPVVPQSVRTQSSFQYLFTLLGPTSVKAVRRTLVKLTLDLRRLHLSPRTSSYETLVEKILDNLRLG